MAFSVTFSVSNCQISIGIDLRQTVISTTDMKLFALQLKQKNLSWVFYTELCTEFYTEILKQLLSIIFFFGFLGAASEEKKEEKKRER